MTSITKVVIITGVLPLLAGCPEGSGNGQPSPPPSPTPSAEARHSAILEQELRDEREKLGKLTKALAESQRQKTEREESRHRWQVASFVLAGGCLLAIFAGAALGTRARHETRPQ